MVSLSKTHIIYATSRIMGKRRQVARTPNFKHSIWSARDLSPLSNDGTCHVK